MFFNTPFSGISPMSSITCDSWTPAEAPPQMGLSNLLKTPETIGFPPASGKGGLQSVHEVRSTISHIQSRIPHPPWQVH